MTDYDSDDLLLDEEGDDVRSGQAGLSESEDEDMAVMDEVGLEDDFDDELSDGEEEDRMDSPAEVGIIEEMTLENFMSHQHFHLKFDENVNFIVGENGSGKSAILVGILVGLGASAKASQRGMRIGDLVREGSNFAKVIIKLRNRGTGAYQPDVYGDSIHVVRQFQKNNQSSYVLKSAGGAVKSTKRSELRRILEHMNIQIDNPCAIMTQETSKRFLKSTSPKDRFKLFLEGTQLQLLYNNYQDTNDQMKTMAEVIASKNDILVDMKREVDDLQRQYDERKHVKKLKEQLKDLRMDLVWALVLHAEKNLAECTSSYEQYEVLSEKVEKKIIAKQSEQAEIREQLDEKQGKLREVENIGEELRREYNDRTVAYKKHCGREKAAENTIKELRRKIDSRKKRLAKINREIEEMQRKLETDREGELNAARERVSQKEEEVRVASNTLTEIMSEKDKLAKQKSYLQEDSSAMRKDLAHREKDLGRIADEVKHLEQANRNASKLGKFGGDIVRIRTLIDRNQNRFKQVPIGPIGAHLKISDKEWSHTVECFMGKTLFTFIADNLQDARTLRELAGRTDLSIVVQRFRNQPYTNLPRYRTNLPSLLDVLRCDVPMVMNVLIDQRGVERVFLAETFSDGVRALEHDPSIEVRTKELHRMFSKKGTRTTMNLRHHHKQLLTGDSSVVLQNLRMHQERLHHEFEQLKGLYQPKEAEIRVVSAELSKVQREISKTQSKLNTLKRQGKDLQDALDDLVAEAEPQTEGLIEARQQLREEIDEVAAEVGQKEEDFKALQTERQAFTQARVDAREKCEEHGKVQDTATTAVDSIQHALAKAITQEKRAVTRRAEIRDQLRSCKKDVDNATKELEKHITEAKKISPERREPRAKPEVLDKKILSTSKRIQSEEKNHRPLHEIEKELTESKHHLRLVLKEVGKLKMVNKKLEFMLQMRIKFWRKFRQAIAERSNVYFNINMARRNFSGRLDFDFKEQHLHINIHENSTATLLDLEKKKRTKKSAADAAAIDDAQPAMRSLQGLSGGERSYATVSLLLSLWDAIGTPFRAMDEFDVFMDAGNREVAIKLLLEVANEQKGRQFIFISPNENQLVKAKRWVFVCQSILFPQHLFSHITAVCMCV